MVKPGFRKGGIAGGPPKASAATTVQARDPVGDLRARHIWLTTGGMIAVVAGLILPHLRPVKHSLQALVIVVGSTVALRSLLALASTRAPGRGGKATSLDRYFLMLLIGTFLLIALPFLVFDVIRAGYQTPLQGFNEGVNLFHVSRLLHGRPLYPALTGDLPVTPLNYSPLSFVILSAFDRLTGAPLFAGRTVSLLCVACLAWLVFRISGTLSGNTTAAALGACFWVALMTRYSGTYLGMYDPQFLGQALSVGAASLYAQWLDRMTLRRSTALALLCCLALFVKFLFIPVPLALALALLLRDRKHAVTFMLAGIVIFSALLLASWGIWGSEMFRNLSVELTPQYRDYARWERFVLEVFFSPFGFALLALSIVLFFVRRPGTEFVLCYLVVAAVAGLYLIRTRDSGVNLWFDLFIGAAIAIGLFAGEVGRLPVAWARRVLYLVLVCAGLSLLTNLKPDLGWVFDYGALRRDEQAYRQDVEALRSIPGPALFEHTVLAFDAGKEFLFDPLLGSRLMLAGRLPESILVDRIRQRYFGVVVLRFDLHKLLGEMRNSETWPQARTAAVTRTTWTWFTDNVLSAIDENYELVPIPRRFALMRDCGFFYCQQEYLFYVPRKSGHRQPAASDVDVTAMSGGRR